MPNGTLIWRFTKGFDLKISPDELERLSEFSKEQFLHYAYLNHATGQFILCFDDARFFNHSDEPNVDEADAPEDSEGINFVARDIVAGEELTCDYKEFNADYIKEPK